MNTSSFQAAITLRKLVAALERMTNEELARLNEPGTDIEIKVLRKRSKDESKSNELPDLAHIIAKLAEAESRTDASKFLEDNFGTKKALEQIARHLDVLVSKQDKVENLRERIIEATVGARLRSEAIQGHN